MGWIPIKKKQTKKLHKYTISFIFTGEILYGKLHFFHSVCNILKDPIVAISHIAVNKISEKLYEEISQKYRIKN